MTDLAGRGPLGPKTGKAGPKPKRPIPKRSRKREAYMNSAARRKAERHMAAVADRAEAAEAKLAEMEAERDYYRDEDSASVGMLTAERARTAELEAENARLVSAYRIEAMRRPEYTHEAFDAHIAALKGDRHEP